MEIMSDIAALTTSRDAPPAPAMSVDRPSRMDHETKLFLSYQVILIEVFLLSLLIFGYAGVIVFAKAMAAFVLVTIVAVTSTGLLRRRRS
jgi:hypothetical protein